MTCPIAPECLLLASPGADENRQPEAQQNIADDRSGDGGLDHVGVARAQDEEREHEFRCVAERDVEQAADGGASALGDLLRRAANPAAERNNRSRARGKYPHRRGVEQHQCHR